MYLNKLIELGCCEKNEYFDLYCNLILNNKNTQQQKWITQKHHIFPRSFNKKLDNIIENIDDSNNLVNLTYTDHVLSHLYLLKCSIGIYKSLSLFAVKRCLENKIVYNKNSNFDKLIKENNFDSIYFEICENMSNLNKGKILIHKDNIQKYILKDDNIQNYLDQGWELGNVFHYNWIYKDNIEKTVTDDELQDYLNKGWNKGFSPNIKNKHKNKITIYLENKELHVDESELENYLNCGWNIGRPKSFSYINKNNNINTTFVNKDGIIKRIKNEDLEKYLNEGWQKGNPNKYILINNGIEHKRILETELNTYISQGWQKGLTNESRKKASLSHTGKQAWNKGIPMSIESKKKRLDTLNAKYLTGWRCKKSDSFKLKISESQKNRKYISKNGIVKNVKIEELDYYLNLGWQIGRKG